jgi:hypothetical protein
MPGVASYQRFVLARGATWQTTVEVRDAAGGLIDLTGAGVVMQVRTVAAAADPVLLELSTGNGRISVANPGTLVLRLTGAETDALPWSHGVYDVRLTLADQTMVLLRGEMLIDPTVTR